MAVSKPQPARDELAKTEPQEAAKPRPAPAPATKPARPDDEPPISELLGALKGLINRYGKEELLRIIDLLG